MARTTRTPLQRPPIDADELAELGYDILICYYEIIRAVRRGSLADVIGAAADLERIGGLLAPKPASDGPPSYYDACLDDAGKALDAALEREPANTKSPIKLSDPMRDYLSRSAAELVEATCHPDDVIALGPGVLLPGDGVPHVCPETAAELSNRDDALGRLHDELTGHVLVPACRCHVDPAFHQRKAD